MICAKSAITLTTRTAARETCSSRHYVEFAPTAYAGMADSTMRASDPRRCRLVGAQNALICKTQLRSVDGPDGHTGGYRTPIIRVVITESSRTPLCPARQRFLPNRDLSDRWHTFCEPCADHLVRTATGDKFSPVGKRPSKQRVAGSNPARPPAAAKSPSRRHAPAACHHSASTAAEGLASVVCGSP